MHISWDVLYFPCRLREELKLALEQLQENQELNKTLHLELSFYEKMHGEPGRPGRVAGYITDMPINSLAPGRFEWNFR